MAQRKEMTEEQKAASWQNSRGSLNYDRYGVLRPVGNAYCPSQHCRMTNMILVADDYGNHSDSSGVVDHKIALDNGGSNHNNNLQAMHNYCNNVKRNKY